ncbi:ERF family protein [Limosilactobacillus ingluviei]|uniref:ERF family protein n=1 Tax=Limosilactobacillus ingluviei TaxID=148604 RepID=UPI00265DC619|nr:ERF family protein [Limosilactobacillus ingluviei]
MDLMMSETIGELTKGLAKFHSQLKQPKLNSENPFFHKNYLDLTGLQSAVDEAMKGTGLSYIQLVAGSNGQPTVRTVILHESGEFISSDTLQLRPDKTNPQGQGSAITYAKRYQLGAMFGISGEADDDGEAATNHQAQNRTYQQRQQSARQAAPRQQRQQAASQPPQPSPEEQQQIDGLKTEYKNVLNGLVKQGAQKKEINNEVNNRLKRSIKDFTKKDELSKWTDALAMIQKIANERTQNLFEEVPEANAQ